MPSAIPNVIEVDITNLGVGDTFSAGEIVLDESLELQSPKDMLIVSVTLPTKEAETIEEESEGDSESDTASDNNSQESSDDKGSESGNEA